VTSPANDAPLVDLCRALMPEKTVQKFFQAVTKHKCDN